jgi:hypothetical protein
VGASAQGRVDGEVWLHPPAADGGGVHGGFVSDSTTIVDFAFDGAMRALEPGSSSKPARYLYLGASKVCAEARRLEIGSAEECAVRDVFRLFCEENLPADSLVAYRNLSGQQQDALRIKPVLRLLDEQASKASHAK